MYTFEEFLLEDFDWDPLNEDYAQQAARNQEKIMRISDRMKSTKRRADEITRSVQNYADKAGKTKDDIAKAVYDSKINSAKAKKAAYESYIIYLQRLQAYHQVKGSEIDAKMKASNRRKA